MRYERVVVLVREADDTGLGVLPLALRDDLGRDRTGQRGLEDPCELVDEQPGLSSSSASYSEYYSLFGLSSLGGRRARRISHICRDERACQEGAQQEQERGRSEGYHGVAG